MPVVALCGVPWLSEGERAGLIAPPLDSIDRVACRLLEASASAADLCAAVKPKDGGTTPVMVSARV